MSCVYAGLCALRDCVNSTVSLLSFPHNTWIGGHGKHWACPVVSFVPRNTTVRTRRQALGSRARAERVRR
jgi:ribonuclease PH